MVKILCYLSYQMKLYLFVYTLISLIVCIVSNSVKNKIEEYRGPLGAYMKWEEERHYLRIHCIFTNYVLDKENFAPFKEKKKVYFIEIEDCFLLHTNLVDILSKINIDVTKLHTLKLLNPKVSDNEYPEDIYSKGLTVQELQLYTLIVEYLYLTWDPKYRNISQFLIFQSLPHSIPKLTLYYSWIKDWSNCEDLLELNVYGMPAELIPKDWHFNCSNLETVRLDGVQEHQVHDRLKDGLSDTWKNIKSLTMKQCNLHRLPFEILTLTERLEYLDLSNNFLEEISDLYINLEYLKILDLSKNNIRTFGELFNLPSITNLSLNENKLISNPICVISGRQCVTTSHENINVLSLNDNPEMELNYLFSTADVTWEKFRNLKRLNVAISGNGSDEVIELSRLIRMRRLHIELNLTGRNFREIEFVDYAYRDLPEELNGTDIGINMTIPSKGLDCDCKHYWLARALTDYSDLLSVPNLRCSSGHEIIHEPLTNLNCEKVRDDDKVTVRKWDNYSSIHWHKKYDVDWKEIAQIASKLPSGSVQSLEVRNNSITSLYEAYLPGSLLTIDLSGNKISRLDSGEAALLFSQPARRVRLAGNLLICDCDNQPLLDALHQHHHQVEDYDALTCIDSGEPLSFTSSFQACLLRNSITISSVVASLILMVALMLWRYRYHIRVYLHSHGWCWSCLSEEDLDAGKPFDAFVSYSHKDSSYVLEQLLPKLEGRPYCYKICVHFRDWTVGDWIPAQIMRSVSASKRVIIVLSRNFATSEWGKLEFRYALSGLAKSGRFKLLVLILDDVLSIPLDAEMQGYIALNTYMRCDDPLFWERLCYAMPHRKRLPPEDNETGAPVEGIVMEVL